MESESECKACVYQEERTLLSHAPKRWRARVRAMQFTSFWDAEEEVWEEEPTQRRSAIPPSLLGDRPCKHRQACSS